jgi:hypothetical protein
VKIKKPAKPKARLKALKPIGKQYAEVLRLRRVIAATQPTKDGHAHKK